MGTAKLILGDCIEKMKELPSESVDAVICDPPYNIGIAEWDKIENYESWLMEVLTACQRILKKNGTLWFFHMDFVVLAHLQIRIEKQLSLRHKQLIIIDKGLQSIAGRSSDMLRSYPRATEYLQFYTFDDPTGAEQLGEQYAKINPMAKYLQEEFQRAGITNREISTLFPSKTGGLTGCVSNWTLGLNFPLKEQYEAIREYLNRNKNDEYLRREYEDLRYTFNLESRCTDVWRINFYEKEKIEHCTPKPIPLMARIVKTATTEGGTVLDMFMGSGSTGVAALRLNRNFIGIEIDPNYFAITEKRIKIEKEQSRLF